MGTAACRGSDPGLTGSRRPGQNLEGGRRAWGSRTLAGAQRSATAWPLVLRPLLPHSFLLCFFLFLFPFAISPPLHPTSFCLSSLGSFFSSFLSASLDPCIGSFPPTPGLPRGEEQLSPGQARGLPGGGWLSGGSLKRQAKSLGWNCGSTSMVLPSPSCRHQVQCYHG